jgi:hypothetical protein
MYPRVDDWDIFFGKHIFLFGECENFEGCFFCCEKFTPVRGEVALDKGFRGVNCKIQLNQSKMKNLSALSSLKGYWR